MKRPFWRRRWILWSGTTLLVLGLLYGLRWPLFGSLVDRIVARQLQAIPVGRVRYGGRDGTLLSGVRLRDLRLTPTPEGPLAALEVRSLEVHYPWFGLRGLRFRIRGAEVRLAGTPPSGQRLNDQIREGLRSLETLKLPGTIVLADIDLILADGSPVRIREARISDQGSSGVASTPAWGSVRFTLERGPSHQLKVALGLERGPVRALSAEIRGDRDHAVRITAQVQDRELVFAGRAAFDEKDDLKSLDGRLDAAEGEASLAANLVTGSVRADSRAGFRWAGDPRGTLQVEGALEGNLSRPPEAWKVSRLKLGGSFLWKSIPLTLDLSSTGGTLAELGWQGSLRRGEDELLGEGTVGWSGSIGLACRVGLRARNLNAYSDLLPPGRSLGLEELSVQAELHLWKSAPWAAGTVSLGRGHLESLQWQSLWLAARVDPTTIDLCQLVVRGMSPLRSATLSGQLRLSGSDPGLDWTALAKPESPATVSVDLRTQEMDLAAPVGTVSDLWIRASGGPRGIDAFDVRGRLGEGPFRAIGHWNLRGPGHDALLHLMGDDLAVYSDHGGRLRVTPNLWFRGEPSGWSLQGSVDVPTLLFYDDFPESPKDGKPSVQAAAAPKLRLQADPGGGFILAEGPKTAEPIRLDLELRTTRPARIENSMLGALVNADLHVGGTLGAPAFSGSLGGRRGEVKLATGIVLRVEQVHLELPRGFGQFPSVYFKGQSGKGQGQITVVVSGSLENPTLTLSSDPPRKQEELLAYLAFGHLPGDLGSQGALGLAATQVVAQVSDSRPRAEPKDGFWQKLDLGVASEDAPDPTKRAPWELPPTASARGTIVRTEYPLNRLFSVVVESDREANLSGDLKLRLLFR